MSFALSEPEVSLFFRRKKTTAVKASDEFHHHHTFSQSRCFANRASKHDNSWTSNWRYVTKPPNSPQEFVIGKTINQSSCLGCDPGVSKKTERMGVQSTRMREPASLVDGCAVEASRNDRCRVLTGLPEDHKVKSAACHVNVRRNSPGLRDILQRPACPISLCTLGWPTDAGFCACFDFSAVAFSCLSQHLEKLESGVLLR